MASRHAVAFISSVLGLWLYSSASDAAVTHTTANLNLRSGPSTSHKVKAVMSDAPLGQGLPWSCCERLGRGHVYGLLMRKGWLRWP